MKQITIIMPFLNEKEEPKLTIESIYQTANPDCFEIIVIDDNSTDHSDIPKKPEVHYVRNSERMGVDACRQMGIDMSKTPFVFIIDAHMRFQPGWMEKMLFCLQKEPKTAWCTRCLGLGYGTMDLNRYNGVYNGATMLFVDKNAKPDRPAREVLEPKWLSLNNELEYEIPCILGANYGFSKEWIDYIHGFRGLKMWGTSEPFLSLKSWMAGGKCKIRTDIAIGHKFRDKAPYATETALMVYNKMFLCKTILPEELGDKLIKYMPHNQTFRSAMRLIEQNKDMIAQEREYYSKIFRLPIYDYCKKFDIDLPS